MVNSKSTAREASHQALASRHLLRPNREPQRKARSLTELARNLNAAGVQIDHHLDEMETNARADDSRHVAAAMITLEQSIKIARRYADAPIGDGDDDAVGND